MWEKEALFYSSLKINLSSSLKTSSYLVKTRYGNLVTLQDKYK